MSKLYCVYALSDPRTNEIRYIGKTQQALKKRLRQHMARENLRTRTHKNCWLSKLIRIDSQPIIDIIEICHSAAALDDAEKFWIAYWRFIGANLTNSTEGGDGGVMSETVRAKLRAYNTGRTHSTTTKTKLSVIARAADFGGAHIQTETERTKRRISLKGHSVSLETRKKISKRFKGHPLTTEHRQKIGDAKRGKKRKPTTEAHRLALSQAKGGYPIVDQNGTVYASAAIAATQLGLSQGAVWNVLHGHRPAYQRVRVFLPALVIWFNGQNRLYLHRPARRR